MSSSLLRLAPWRRGPLLLLRRPGVAVALMSAAFVATLPAVAMPLFLSSAENATLHREIRELCQWQVGLQVTNELWLGNELIDGLSSIEAYRRRNAEVAAAAPAGLGPAVTTLDTSVTVDPIDRPALMPDARGLSLIARDRFDTHVEVVDGPRGSGIWLPNTFATGQGIRVGDRLRLTRRSLAPPDEPPPPHTITVAAIFRDLRSLPDQPYWCSLREHYRGAPGQEFSNTPILPMALTDVETFLTAGAAMDAPASHWIEYAVADPTAPAPELKTVARDVQQTVVRIQSAEALDLTFNSRSTSLLGLRIRRAALVRTGLLPPVVPITAAGVLVGLAVVAAATIFWVQRRRQELAVLAAHGVGAPGLGLKAVAEALPAILVGATGGGGAAWALVRWIGPSPVLSPGAVPRAALAAGAAALIALAVVGLVAAIRCRGLADVTVAHRRGRWTRLPVELLLLAAAPIAWVTLAASTTTTSTEGIGAGEVAHVPARLLVVPILGIAGVTILAGRVVAARLRRRGLARTPRRPAALLAWRRIIRDATASAVLAAATAVPIAMAAYGAMVTDSIRTTADAELRMLLGTDAVATLERGEQRTAIPAGLASRATEIQRLDGQSLDATTVDIIAVDPATFAKGAFWDNRMGGATLAAAAAAVTAGSTPTVVVSQLATPGDATLSLIEKDIHVRVVAVRPLPGEQSGYPVVLVHRDLFTDMRCCVTMRQWWIRGDLADTRREIASARAPLTRFTTIDDLRVGWLHEPVRHTFQYLVALSIFTGLIAVVGLLLFLESRAVTHQRAYVLLRRLGLRPRAHRRALLVEIGVPVTVGVVGGLALVAGLAYALGETFEINQTRQPGAILALPTTMIAVVCAAAAVIAVGAAAFAHRRVVRANPSEVLRDTP